MSVKKEFTKFATKHRGIRYDGLDNYVKDVENMTRSVIEERPRPFREIDVFSRLIMDRIIFLGTKIDDTIANIIVAQLLFLEAVKPDQEITLYINSPGGSVYDGLAIYDTMQHVSSPVRTVGLGIAASMGAVLLTAGEKGLRSALPHTRVMIHQPLGGTKGQMVDMKIAVDAIVEVGNDLYKILSLHSGQPIDKIRLDADRDCWMRAEKAKAYGLIDDVLAKSAKHLPN